MYIYFLEDKLDSPALSSSSVSLSSAWNSSTVTSKPTSSNVVVNRTTSGTFNYTNLHFTFPLVREFTQKLVEVSEHLSPHIHHKSSKLSPANRNGTKVRRNRKAGDRLRFMNRVLRREMEQLKNATNEKIVYYEHIRIPTQKNASSKSNQVESNQSTESGDANQIGHNSTKATKPNPSARHHVFSVFQLTQRLQSNALRPFVSAFQKLRHNRLIG